MLTWSVITQYYEDGMPRSLETGAAVLLLA
jgi:hypothetical protein